MKLFLFFSNTFVDTMGSNHVKHTPQSFEKRLTSSCVRKIHKLIEKKHTTKIYNEKTDQLLKKKSATSIIIITYIQFAQMLIIGEPKS